MPPQADIERIVRRVVSRLRESRQEDEPKQHALTLPDRVVTLSTIRGRLEGIQRLAVASRAVITPAVRDELRQRNIQLVHTTTDNGQPAPDALLVGAVTAQRDSEKQLAWLNDETIAIELLPETTLPTLIERMAVEMMQNNRIAMLLTDQTAVALCLANRNLGVRAALGCNAETTRRAIDGLGANLLVVDPSNKSQFELRCVARQFASGRPRLCPDELKPFLEK